MITYRKEERIPPLAEACIASRSRRFAELLIDVALISFICSIAFCIWLIKTNNLENYGTWLSNPLSPSPEYIALMGKIRILVSLGLFIYYFVCEAFFRGKTFGKLLLHTRTTDIDGNRPSTGAVALRTICRVIPLSELSILFGNYWDKGKIRGNWYDKLSGTYVVKDVLAEKYRSVYGRTRLTRSALASSSTAAPSQSRTGTSPLASRTAPAPAGKPQETAPKAAPTLPDLRAGDRVRHRYAGFETVVTSVLPDGTVSTPQGDFPASHLERV